MPTREAHWSLGVHAIQGRGCDNHIGAFPACQSLVSNPSRDRAGVVWCEALLLAWTLGLWPKALS